MTAQATWPARYNDWVNRRLGIVPLDEADAAALRRAGRAIRPGASGHPVVQPAVGRAGRDHGHDAWLALVSLFWSASVVAIGVLGILRITRIRERAREESPSAKFNDRILIDSALMAAPWLVMAIVFNPTRVPEMEVLTATLLGGAGLRRHLHMASMPSAALLLRRPDPGRAHPPYRPVAARPCGREPDLQWI